MEPWLVLFCHLSFESVVVRFMQIVARSLLCSIPLQENSAFFIHSVGGHMLISTPGLLQLTLL